MPNVLKLPVFSPPAEVPPVTPPPQLGITPLAPLTTRAKGVAAILGIGLRTVHTWDAAGKLPKPLRHPGGGAVLWVVSEIESWIAAGRPDRAAWEAMKATRKK